MRARARPRARGRERSCSRCTGRTASAFHLGASVASITAERVVPRGTRQLPADLVVMGVGVRPRTVLAEPAGLRVDRGIVVDERLQTSAPGVYAAGDVARYPDPWFGEAIRIEHWAVAERRGPRPRAPSWAVGAFPRRPVLLERALRRDARVRRPCRAVGPHPTATAASPRATPRSPIARGT